MLGKRISFLLAVCLALAAFAGCSSSPAAPPGDSLPSGSPSTAAADPERAVELVLWHTYTAETNHDPFEATVYGYQEVNPNVTFECVAYSTTDIITNLNTAVLAGTMPDFAVLDNPKYAALVETGIFAPMTEWFYAWEESALFKENCLDMGTVDGELYGILYDPCALALWCNAGILQAAGYTEAPKTLDEFIEVALACTDASQGIYGFATSTRQEEQGSVFQHGAFILSAGGTIYDLNSEAGLAWANMTHTLYSDNAISKESLNWTQGDAFNQWMAGNAAMCLSGDWNITTFLNPEQNTNNIEVWMAEIPTHNGNKSSGYFGGEMIGITNNCEEPQAAYAFLEYWLGRDVMREVDLAVAKASGRTDLDNREIYAGEDPAVMEMKMFYDGIVETAVPRGPDARWMDISDAFIECMQSIAIGTTEPEEAVATAAEKISRITG